MVTQFCYTALTNDSIEHYHRVIGCLALCSRGSGGGSPDLLEVVIASNVCFWVGIWTALVLLCLYV
jgi:hypothetical protein